MPVCALSVAGLTIRMDLDCEVEQTQAFLPFLTEAEIADYEASFDLVGKLPSIPDKQIHEDKCYRVHLNQEGNQIRSFFDAPNDFSAYAVAIYDYPAGRIRVSYLEKGKRCLSEIHNSFFHLGFESMLLYRERLCFHAACVRTALGGILFSGPSGIGKSTQAALWCQHRGAEQINGDRPILSKGNGEWLAWGSPYAGSSHCYINASCPVRAIVMLRQAENCSLRRLSIKEAFRAIWSGLTVPAWDAKATEAACDLTLELSAAVPVYEFGCTPDAAAVEFLEQGLGKDSAL